MPSPTCNSGGAYAFAVALTVYSSLEKEKSVKTKELLFTVNDDNYVGFLRSILNKHGQGHYKVEKKRFPFKFVLPEAKSQHANDATDVYDEADYQEMVKKIRSANLGTTKIYVDMKQIEKLPSSCNSEDEDSETSDADVGESPSHGVLDLDARLARWRLKLQNRYKNEYDEGFTYVGPMGEIPLTPAMILDWCRALEEGQATLTTPPSLESFNMANKAPFLHPARKAQPPLPATPSVDVNLLISVLLLQTLVNSGLLSSVSSPSHPTVANVPAPPPATPAPTSPPLPSPSQLPRFLHYAETHLGVRDATTYERDLELRRIGPDILADIDDKTLAGIGIPTGDIIRLKKGSLVWWNGPEAKRKRSNNATSLGTGYRTSDAQPPRKKVAYEKRYHDGRRHRFLGPPMQPDGDGLVKGTCTAS